MRCRQEHMERLHLKHQHRHNILVTAGRAAESTYDAAMPWDAIWEAAVEDDKFWKQEFENPALKYMLWTGKFKAPMTQILDGDAAIMRGQPASSNAPPSKPHQATRPQKPAAPNKPAATNKAELCKRFNSGSCPPSASVHCTLDSNRLHKCRICGAEGHGANDCPTTQKKNAAGKKNTWGKKNRR